MPDHTRPLDRASALSALSERMELGAVVVGGGLHRASTAAELDPIRDWSPVVHDPDDTVPTATVDGVPGRVSRALEGHDALVSVGVAELHQYAGLSGGHKGVAVGCGGRATIAALHHRDRVLTDGVRLGQLDGNPFRAAVDALGEAAGCRAALLWAPAVGLWIAGPPRAALEEARRRIHPWTYTDALYERAVLRVPPSKASSLYQASRAATYLALSPRPPLRPGATLYLDAACPEGLGTEAGFVAALSRVPPPWSPLLTGPPPEGPGAQRAVMLALLARDYRLVVTGCAAPEALRAAGVEATADPPPVGDWLVVDRPFDRIPQRAEPA